MTSTFRQMDTDNTTVCIGVFDGVHRGHQALINKGRSVADQVGNQLVVVTFDPHPLAVVNPERAPRMITSVSQRIELLKAAGADDIHVLAFTNELSSLSSEQFVTQELVDRLRATSVVVGENFTFGYRAQGNVQTLAELGASYGFSVHVVPLEQDSESISSSRIRRFVEEGNLTDAVRLLGHPFRVAGQVVMGDRRGRDLGYPTANLRWPQSALIPAEGVYAGYVIVDGERHPAAISVGTNPQFAGVNQRVEAFIMEGKHWDLYGQPVEFEFTEFMRSQLVFTQIEDYLGQMKLDVAGAHRILSAGLLP